MYTNRGPTTLPLVCVFVDVVVRDSCLPDRCWRAVIHYIVNYKSRNCTYFMIISTWLTRAVDRIGTFVEISFRIMRIFGEVFFIRQKQSFSLDELFRLLLTNCQIMVPCPFYVLGLEFLWYVSRSSGTERFGTRLLNMYMHDLIRKKQQQRKRVV